MVKRTASSRIQTQTAISVRCILSFKSRMTNYSRSELNFFLFNIHQMKKLDGGAKIPRSVMNFMKNICDN